MGFKFSANVKKEYIKGAFVHNALVHKFDENWRTFMRSINNNTKKPFYGVG